MIKPNNLSISQFVSCIASSINTALSVYGSDGGVPNEMMIAANKFRDELVLEHADWLKSQDGQPSRKELSRAISEIESRR